jgi:gluconokinase
MCILIIDVGSSSVRALLFDHESALISDAIARREYRFDADATADAHQLRQMVESCLDEMLMHPSSKAIQAVGMATFVGNLLGVDENNHPLTPLYTYADNRSGDFANRLSEQFDTQAVHARTGCRIHSAYHPAKLHWLKNSQPALFASVTHWQDFGTYCYQAWFGRAVPCSYSVASWSGLLNRETLSWDAVWLDWLGIDENQLPHLADYNDTQQGLNAPYADRWHVLRGVPFYLAIGDGAGANIGCGGISPEYPVLTVGTTSAMRIITPHNTSPHSGLWSYRVDAGHHLVGGATNEGGNIFAWAKSVLNLAISDSDEALLQHDPTTQGLIALPLFSGERSPNYNTSATGTLHGIGLHTTPLDMLHTLMSGVALRMRLILDALNTPSDYILAGGGALYQSDAWAQIFADVLARPLYVLSEQEVTARGVYNLINYGGIGNIPISDNRHDKHFFPRPHYSHYYADLLIQQEILYQKLYHKG